MRDSCKEPWVDKSVINIVRKKFILLLHQPVVLNNARQNLITSRPPKTQKGNLKQRAVWKKELILKGQRDDEKLYCASVPDH